jgi:hypothetical protein
MRKVSKKLAKEHREYSKLRKEWLTERPMCQAKIHRCTLKSTDVHHKKGRGVYLLDTNTWLSVCRSCHNWIETHPEDAKELGFSISKINK